jgi:hypothetical protein
MQVFLNYIVEMNVALLTFEGAAFYVTFLALLLILVYPLTMALKQQ